MNYIKKYIDKNILIYLIISLVFFGILCIMNFTLDTYSVFSSDKIKLIEHYASCGRFISAIISFIFLRRIGNECLYAFSFIFAIIFTVLSMFEIHKLIEKYVKNNYLKYIISTLIIINPFSIELFMYIEKSIMILSIFLCVLALKNTIQFFENSKKKNILIAMIFMFIANCCYQGTVGIYVVLATVFIIKYSKNIKDFIINNLITVAIYGVPATLNYILIKVFGANIRVSGGINLLESLKKVFEGIYTIFWESFNLMPEGLIFSFLLIVAGITIYYLIKNKGKYKVTYIVGLIYIIIVSIGATVAPQLLQGTEYIWFVARSSYPAAAIIGVIILYLAINCDIKNITNYAIYALSGIFLIIQLFYFSKIIVGNYIVEYEDKKRAVEIINMMNEYEKETGNKVEKISYYSDKNPRIVYPGIEISVDINITAFASDWATRAIIEYYSGRRIYPENPDEEIKNEFNKKDWQEFSKEQIILKENTLHICNY